jgi:hypothetical protein
VSGNQFSVLGKITGLKPGLYKVKPNSAAGTEKRLLITHNFFPFLLPAEDGFADALDGDFCYFAGAL